LALPLLPVSVRVMRHLPPLFLCLAACAPEAAEQQTGEREPNFDLLGGMGYAGWDPDAVEELSGVTLHDATHAYAGINLYANDVDTGIAVSMSGERVHEWRFPGRTQVEYFELMPDGGAIGISVDEGVSCVSASGKERWSADLNAHHDVELLTDGGAWIPVWEEREFLGRCVRFDDLVRVDKAGVVQERWSTYDSREVLGALHGRSGLDTAAQQPVDRVYDYYHLNTVRVIGESARAADPRFRPGNLLVCMRNVSLVCVLDASSRELLWHYGPGELDFPHFPTLTPAGNVLIFDNGYHRERSRVVEVDPDTKEIVWEYGSRPGEEFFTQLRGSAQRLPNGNTLICESERGHAFEVRPSGERVWEFWNPDFRDGERRRIYRLLRVSEEVSSSFRGRR